MVEDLVGRGLRVAEAEIGIVSNNPSLIYTPEYFEGLPHPAVVEGKGWLIQSQTANFKIKDVEYRPPPEMDSYFYILDYRGVEPYVSIGEREVMAVGDWSAMEREVSDRRYTLLGNQGLLFRYILVTLERRHGIYNFHACALYDEEKNLMLFALGERGSGKSALLLSALDKGIFKLFATEIVHVGIKDGDIIFYKGTVRNNVRAGHLIYDFPKISEKIGVKFSELKDPWGTKIQVDLSSFQVEREVIINPRIIIVIPRIEEYNKICQYSLIKDYRKLKRILVENVSDKIVTFTSMYEVIPIGALDDLKMRRKRIEFMDRFIKMANIEKVVSLFASPKNCLEGWL